MLKIAPDRIVDPEDILFWIPTHNDTARLANALASIRAIYPEVLIVVYSDREALFKTTSKIAKHFNAKIFKCNEFLHYGKLPRIRSLHYGWLKWFLENTNRQWFLKFDTDSVLQHPFRSFPSGVIFGRIYGISDGLPFPQGGCYGLDRKASEIIIESGKPTVDEILSIMNSNQLRNWTYDRFCEDRYLGWLGRRAKVDIVNCPEISSEIPNFKHSPMASVIHPASNFKTGLNVLKSIKIKPIVISKHFHPLVNFLSKYPHFDWLPNVGNWGDSLIRAGAELLFAKMKLVASRITELRRGSVLVYGGGGAWCSCFGIGREICIQAAMEFYDTVIVLPSTYENLPNYLPSNLILIARDEESRKLSNSPLPAIPDLAFLLPKQHVLPVKQKLNAWRTNADIHINRPTLPNDNIDISMRGTHDSDVEPFLGFVGRFHEVETDRMHVGIAAAIQQVDSLILRPNGYHKLKSSYETFPDLYPKNTVFKYWVETT